MATTPVGNTRSGLRWSGIAAIAFVVLFVVGFVLTTDTPDGNKSNAVWRRYFLDSGHRTGMIVGAFAFALAGLAFLVFLSVLRERLRHASTGAEWVATLSFASGIAFVAFLGAAALGLANIAADVEFGDSPVPRDASIMRSFESLGMGSMLVCGMAAAGLLILTTSIVAGRTALLPRWIVVTGYVVGVIVLVGGVLFFPLALFLLWMLAVGIVMLTRSRAVV